jgi:hypothetical protein
MMRVKVHFAHATCFACFAALFTFRRHTLRIIEPRRIDNPAARLMCRSRVCGQREEEQERQAKALAEASKRGKAALEQEKEFQAFWKTVSEQNASDSDAGGGGSGVSGVFGGGSDTP